MVKQIERLSIELTNRCAKACWFCYNRAGRGAIAEWAADEALGFVRDCTAHGVRDVSFGGGEPLEYRGLFDLLDGLRGLLHRSITTNGLGLDGGVIRELARTGIEKVHVSIHFPEHDGEVERVIGNVRGLEAAGIRAGVNLLIAKKHFESARRALEKVHAAGIGPERVILLPMRIYDTPTPEEVGEAAGGKPFQSTSCLKGCAKSPRFVSIDALKQAAWCSYTISRHKLPELSFNGLMAALRGLELKSCCGEQQ
ncbi:MAG: radical SAM protein [Candidatus Sumerlaeia bacterium]